MHNHIFGHSHNHNEEKCEHGKTCHSHCEHEHISDHGKDEHSCSHNHEHNHCNHGHEHSHCKHTHSHHSHGHDCCNHSHGNECACGHTHYKKNISDAAGLVFSLIIFIISFFINTSLGGFDILKIISVAICGYKIIYRGILSLIKFRFDENTLMAAASVASVFMGEFNEAFLIVLLFGIGEYLEEYVVEKSNKEIEKLVDITGDSAYDENGQKIDASSVKSGDLLMVRPGDKLCTDATIIEGSTTFDTSNLTGETYPLEASTGDKLLSGYINTGNVILCKASTDYNNSTASRIKEYVTNARKHKASTEKFITKFAKIYTPAVIAGAVCIGTVLVLTGSVTLWEAVRRALTFMIASCPCALVISIPLSYYAAIGTAGKYGMLIKGSKHINTLAKADAIAFDKTGTLTEGKLMLESIEILSGRSKEEILSYACALERNSAHPIARAICAAAPETVFKAENVKEYLGKGIEGIVNSKKVTIGNSKLTQNEPYSPKDGLVLSIDGNAEAVIKLSDSVKSDAKTTIQLLFANKIKSAYILSGDINDEVEKIHTKLNTTDYFGELLPNEKANMLEKLKAKHNGIIFVGDGVNDAPSLACADFSVAMSSASSLALETGDSTLIGKSLEAIVKVRKIASHTVKTIYTNIVFSLGIKALVLILATMGTAPVWLALFADVGVLLLAVLNSLSILYKKF